MRIFGMKGESKPFAFCSYFLYKSLMNISYYKLVKLGGTGGIIVITIRLEFVRFLSSSLLFEHFPLFFPFITLSSIFAPSLVRIRKYLVTKPLCQREIIVQPRCQEFHLAYCTHSIAKIWRSEQVPLSLHKCHYPSMGLISLVVVKGHYYSRFRIECKNLPMPILGRAEESSSANFFCL